MERKFLRRKLKNGMTVIMEKRELPVVCLGIANKFGAAFEDSNVKGISHFIEHLLFTGTANRTSEQISREIEKKGGILNAFTANEVTCYWFKLPSEHVFAGLDILSDMLLNPKFDKEKFEKEKKVILEEIKMYHDDPARHIYDKLESNMYEKPFSENVIGSEKTVKSLERDFVFEYFKKNYDPSNYFVILVGNADFDKICVYFEKNFKKKGVKLQEKKIIKRNSRSVEERHGIDQAHFLFGAHAPLMNDPKYTTLQVLDAYLACGMSSKLFIEIREKRGLAYAVKSAIQYEKNYSYYTIYVGTRKDAIADVEKLIIQEIKNIDQMNESDLNESKQMLMGLRKITKEESASMMNALLFEELGGKAENYYKHDDEIKKVKLEDVKKLAKEIFKEYSVAMIVPK